MPFVDMRLYSACLPLQSATVKLNACNVSALAAKHARSHLPNRSALGDHGRSVQHPSQRDEAVQMVNANVLQTMNDNAWVERKH